MLFLDTHVALWLYAEPFRVPLPTQRVIDESDLYISPMARLEMSFLYEIGRISDDPEGIIGSLTQQLALRIDHEGWCRAADVAAHISWTRDPFDRLIAAHAIAFNASLCTRDPHVRAHYQHAVWIDAQTAPATEL